jgi:hypothetical protein
MWRASVNVLTAMKMSRHEAMAMFKRYNTTDEDDLTAAQQQMDTSAGTKASTLQQYLR